MSYDREVKAKDARILLVVRVRKNRGLRLGIDPPCVTDVSAIWVGDPAQISASGIVLESVRLAVWKCQRLNIVTVSYAVRQSWTRTIYIHQSVVGAVIVCGICPVEGKRVRQT